MSTATQTDNPLRNLMTAPLLAWPTLLLFFAALGVLGLVDYHAVKGNMPLWVGTVINGVTIYLLFSCVHDASHGAISRIKWINELPGHIGMIFFGPIAPFNVARFIHMQHHRFTNDLSQDPDHFGHKMDWLFPLRWSNFDYFYTQYFFMRAPAAMRKKLLPRLLIHFAVIIAALVGLTVAGYGLEALMLWILPTRISSFLFVMAFVYLPHEPFQTTAKQNEYRASNIRPGAEWLLTPLLAYQNYHLMHHLYPTAPFYNMIKLWELKHAEHMANSPLVVKTFGLQPVDGQPHDRGDAA
ncbi:fatty acid desaturase [Pseudomonas sp. K1(2024)]|uniref:Fatty acid desaturase n=1 Tax=Pseudomonas boreofloridensis TaxID=3064348 RepID=A0ABV4Z6C9_9PSED|nr:fatty acid desaturase [Pseudomonas sp. K13]MDO7902051.1 fatty acid desaturase [Pseudomonas sp. K13]